MSKLDLNKYEEREIVAAFFALKASKFLTVMNGLTAVAKRMETRGETIGKDHSEEAVERMIRQLFEGEEQ